MLTFWQNGAKCGTGNTQDTVLCVSLRHILLCSAIMLTDVQFSKHADLSENILRIVMEDLEKSENLEKLNWWTPYKLICGNTLGNLANFNIKDAEPRNLKL